MLISKKAKQDYLERKLDEWDAIKNLSTQELDEWIAELQPSPEFFTDPMKHQKECFLLGNTLPNFLFFADPGSGKTKMLLDILQQRIAAGQMKSALVLVPNVVNIDNWMNEVQRHAPTLSALPLYGSSEEREKALFSSTESLVIVNYQGLLYLCTSKPKNAAKGRSKRRIDNKKVERLAAQFDALVLDEVHLIKNHMSTTFKICDKIGVYVKYRYGLTGTPFGRDPHDLWAQFKVIDRGETLGQTLGLFRSVFFNEKQNYWGGVDYSFRKTMRKRLHKVLKHRSILYNAEEFADMPEQVHYRVDVRFPDDAKEYYRKFIEQLKDKKKSVEERDNIFLRLREISSGFVTLKNSDGEKIQLDFALNPKLEALMDIIDSLPEEEKIIVFNEYTYSGKLITDRLKERKINHRWLYSGTKDPIKATSDFVNDPSCKVFVANAKSGGTGLNIQVAKYLVFFESPTSPIVRKQAEARVTRKGQKSSRTFCYDLLVKGTVDYKILSYIKEGKDLHKAILKGEDPDA